MKLQKPAIVMKINLVSDWHRKVCKRIVKLTWMVFYHVRALELDLKFYTVEPNNRFNTFPHVDILSERRCRGMHKRRCLASSSSQTSYVCLSSLDSNRSHPYLRLFAPPPPPRPRSPRLPSPRRRARHEKVNLSEMSRETILHRQARECSTTVPSCPRMPPGDLFDEAWDEVSILLQRDPFMHFRSSDAFLKLRSGWGKQVRIYKPPRYQHQLARATHCRHFYLPTIAKARQRQRRNMVQTILRRSQAVQRCEDSVESADFVWL